LESSHRGKKEKNNFKEDVESTASERKERWCTVGLLGTSSLKEGVV
jgi:hypothetical protein